MRILLRNFTALTLADESLKDGVWITIDAGRIESITQNPKGVETKGFTKVIEGKDKLVMPGFVNAHTHLSMVLLRGFADDLPLKEWLEEAIWPAETKLTPEDVYWASLLGIAEMLRSGTTAFADMYFYIDEVAKAVEQSGMRALLSYAIIAPRYDRGTIRTLKAAQAFIQEFEGEASGRIRTALSPHALYSCAREVWERTIELALEHKVVIHTHLSETEGEVQDSYKKHGVSPVKYLEELGALEAKVLAAHCVHLSAEDIELLAQRGVAVAHCPTSNMKLGSGIAPIDELIRAGVNVAIGTDGAGTNNNLDMFEEVRLAAFLQKVKGNPTVLPASQVLKMGTVNGAKALGLEAIGTLEEGQKADLIILDLDRPHMVPTHNLISNVVYAAGPADVETVIIDGKIVMEDQEILTFDEQEAKHKVKELSAKYARR